MLEEMKAETKEERDKCSNMVLLFGPLDFIYDFGQYFMDGINFSTL